MDEKKSGLTLDEAVSQLIDTIKTHNQADPNFVQVAIALEIEKDNSLSSLLFLALTGKDNEIINKLKKDINEFDDNPES